MIFLFECLCLMGIGTGGYMLLEIFSEKEGKTSEGKRQLHLKPLITGLGFITIPFIILIGLLNYN